MSGSVQYMGIDPGLGGAIVVISEDGFIDWSQRTPVIQDKGRRRYDVAGMRAVIQDAATDLDRLVVGVEKVGAMPRDGKVGAFNFGMGYGLWLGLLAALSIPHILATPQRWQAQMLAGHPRGPHTKTSAVLCAKALFPTIPIKVKADYGMADAALIAEYTRRLSQGGT